MSTRPKKTRKQLDLMLAEAHARAGGGTSNSWRAISRLRRTLTAYTTRSSRARRPALPDEDEEERPQPRALQIYHEARVKAEAEGQAIRILTDASRMMQAARASMQNALSHSRSMCLAAERCGTCGRGTLSARPSSRYPTAACLHTNQAMQMSPSSFISSRSRLPRRRSAGRTSFF